MTIEPDGAAIINTGERGSADLCGDVVLGVFSARSPKQAMLLSTNEIPAAAKEGFDWYENPEDLGLRAYKLGLGMPDSSEHYIEIYKSSVQSSFS